MITEACISLKARPRQAGLVSGFCSTIPANQFFKIDISPEDIKKIRLAVNRRVIKHEDNNENLFREKGSCRKGGEKIKV